MPVTVLLAAIALNGCASSPRRTESFQTEVGLASWYGRKFQGGLTASGERYDMYRLTAAHPTLPFGTRVRVTRLENGRSVIVRINDRGPFIAGRIIDLSYQAARDLGMIREGLARVRVEVLR
ncbi:MAG TPA: septal ring lytic transglycosylase RlpA family protein [bacterium]|nr:septal ring lytic transglycosylase RlpA family protein [bacterium]